MLKQQAEVLLEEEKETQGIYNFCVYFMTADTKRMTKGCLFQKNRRDENDDWQFKY